MTGPVLGVGMITYYFREVGGDGLSPYSGLGVSRAPRFSATGLVNYRWSYQSAV